MIKSNTNRTFIRLAVAIIGMLLWLSVGSSLAAEKDKMELRWDQQRIRDYPIYRLLLKARSAGSGMPEQIQWAMAKEQGKPFVDPQRETDLTELLSLYPDSEYADDAALLLARARFFYHNDAKGAIENLYKVISKYPKGTWIAEDSLFLEHAMLSNVTKAGKPRNDGWFGRIPSLQDIEKKPEGPSRDMAMKRLAMAQERLTYFEHWEKYPNLTSEEARYWIAKIILYAELTDRYNEAINNLQNVVKAHRTDKRAEIDFLEGKNQNGQLIWSKLLRTERTCHVELIDLYLKMRDFSGVTQSAEEYLSLHKDHATCYEVHRKAGEAYEALENWSKAALHYEKFLTRPRLGNTTIAKYKQKLNEARNKAH